MRTLTKNSSRWMVVGILLTALSINCASENENDIEETSVPTYEEWRDSLFKENGEYGVYIIDEDIPVTNEKKLREVYESRYVTGKLLLAQKGGVDQVWSNSQKQNLTYCVSTNFGSDHQTVVDAMGAAADAWEEAADVDFIYVAAEDSNCGPTNNNVMFDVKLDTTSNGPLARAFFPGETRTMRNVNIWQSAVDATDRPDLTGILRHELGHALGFRHEHTRPEANANSCFEDNSWRALSEYDSDSVMHYPQCNGTGDWSLSLTDIDKAAAAAVYGAPGSGSSGGGSGTPGEGGGDGESIAQGETKQYGPFNVETGTEFSAVMTGTGDADLYVRFGAQPTQSAYNCRPYLNGSNEECKLDVPAGQDQAYVMVYGYTAATFDLDINYTEPPPASGTVTETASGNLGYQETHWYGPIEVVPGSNFDATMAVTSGDADLYVRFGDWPSDADYDCRPYKGTKATEECTGMTVPSNVNEVYIRIYGYSSAAYELEITYDQPAESSEPQEETTNYSGSVSQGGSKYYGPVGVAGGTTLTVAMTGSGDPDLYVRFGNYPSQSSFDCRPYKNGATETCTLTVPEGTDQAYIMVYGYSSGSFNIEVTHFQ